MRQEGLDLGTKDERIIHDRVIKRFDTEIISGAVQRMILLVIDDKRKHTAQFGSGFFSIHLIGLQYDFGVGIRLENAAMVFDQFFTDLSIVIDLTIKYDDIATVLTVDRLRTALQIDDAQSPETQRAVFIYELTIAVRAAVGDQFTHFLDRQFSIIIPRSKKT